MEYEGEERIDYLSPRPMMVMLILCLGAEGT